MVKIASLLCTVSVLLLPLVTAQLSGRVGPLTTRASKQAKVCNVLNYGGVASKSADIGPALLSAFNACKTGGTIYVPPGDYGMSTWVTFDSGKAFAIQLDGIIYRTGTAGGHMILINKGSDVEFYSSTSKGAVQGYGYVFHKTNTYGPRILRLVGTSDFSVHDIALVDSGAFHFVVDSCSNGEIYNLIIRGGNRGGLDGINIFSNNIHVHDVEVSNKDECVTVKSPSKNILIENIYCNWSGGCAMGSLGADTSISNIMYRNVYTYNSNQVYMLKSNGGSGSVSNCQFNNFIGHSNAYSLDLNAFWSSMTKAPGSGVLYHNLTFSNWRGTALNGAQRAPINAICPAGVPCTDIEIDDFEMWTEAGSSVLWKCENVFGKGGCIRSGTGGSYTSTSIIKSGPTNYVAPTMPNHLTSLPITEEIPIPPIPTTFFPGNIPASTLLGS